MAETKTETKKTGAAENAETAAPELGAELARLRAELQDVLAHLRDIGAEGVRVAKAEARARAGEGEAAAERFATGAKAEMHALEAKLGEELRARPLRTLGFAALGGLVLGLILRR